MPRGRKPLPTALKVLQGTDRPDRRRGRTEPRPPDGLPEPPPWLDDVARAEWDRFAPILTQMGVLTIVDGMLLAIYCTSFARWRQAEDALASKGLLVPTPGGGEKVSPYWTISHR